MSGLIRRNNTDAGMARMVTERITRLAPQLQVADAGHADFVICDQTIDLTYIRLHAGWMYLVAVLDWFSRYVVSWELDQTMEVSFVLAAVERALAQATPEIWNSDQGSQFTSSEYIDRLQAAQVHISMDGRGRALDNIFTERLWRTVKYENVYLMDYASVPELEAGLQTYFHFYNHERLHQSLGYHTPASVYLNGRYRFN